MSRNLSPEEKKAWILENCIDEDGDVSLDNIDFSDLNGNVSISGLRVKYDLYQNNQKVNGTLFQHSQIVGEDLEQGRQFVKGCLFQDEQEVECDLVQDCQVVKGMLRQDKLEEQ